MNSDPYGFFVSRFQNKYRVVGWNTGDRRQCLLCCRGFAL